MAPLYFCAKERSEEMETGNVFMFIRLIEDPFDEYRHLIEDKYTDREYLYIFVENCKKMRDIEYVDYRKESKRKGTPDVVIRCSTEARDRIVKKFNLVEMPRRRRGRSNYILCNGSFCVTDKMKEVLQ